MYHTFRLSNTQSTNPPGQELLPAPAAELACKLMDRWEIEQAELLGAVLADPQTLAPIAAGEGVDRHHFTDDGARAVWLAALAGGPMGRDAVLRLAVAAVEGEPLWSADRVRALASAWYPFPGAVRVYARRLQDVADKWWTINVYLKSAIDLLKEAA